MEDAVVFVVTFFLVVRHEVCPPPLECVLQESERHYVPEKGEYVDEGDNGVEDDVDGCWLYGFEDTGPNEHDDDEEDDGHDN